MVKVCDYLQLKNSPGNKLLQNLRCFPAIEVRHFLGEWLDNLGHKIVVSSVSERLGRNQRPGRRDTQHHPEMGLMLESFEETNGDHLVTMFFSCCWV